MGSATASKSVLYKNCPPKSRTKKIIRLFFFENLWRFNNSLKKQNEIFSYENWPKDFSNKINNIIREKIKMKSSLCWY